MGDAPHGPLVFGVEDDGGGGGGPCIGAIPLTYGNNTVSATTATRYLSPSGEMSGTTAQTDPIGYTMQATGAVTRFQIRHRVGAGNGATIDYEAMLLVGGVPTSFPAPLIISVPSTFVGIASITPPAGQVIVDGDQVIVEIRKALATGSSPIDVQAFLQIEDECGGGGGGSACCNPVALSGTMVQQFAFTITAGDVATLDLDAGTCGADEPVTAVIRDSIHFGPQGVAPIPTSPIVVGPNIFRVAIDGTLATDGFYILELTNACGCCWIHPIEIVSG